MSPFPENSKDIEGTVDGRNFCTTWDGAKNLVNNGMKLPTSTGACWISEPSTVLIVSPTIYTYHDCDVGVTTPKSPCDVDPNPPHIEGLGDE